MRTIQLDEQCANIEERLRFKPPQWFPIARESCMEVREGECAIVEDGTLALLTTHLITCVCLSLVAENNITHAIAIFLAHLNCRINADLLKQSMTGFLEGKTLTKACIIAGSAGLEPDGRTSRPGGMTSKVNVFMALHCLHEVSQKQISELYSSYKATVDQTAVVGVNPSGAFYYGRESPHAISQEYINDRIPATYDDFIRQLCEEMCSYLSLCCMSQIRTVTNPQSYLNQTAFKFARSCFPAAIQTAVEERVARQGIMDQEAHDRQGFIEFT